MKNLVIAQSGGPTAAINATVEGILQGVRLHNEIDNVYGAKNGIDGLINEELIDLNWIVRDVECLDALRYTPSAALGTCRTKLGEWEEDKELYEKIVSTLLKNNIKYLIYIGGNDSMDTVRKLSDYCKDNDYDIVVIGAPKTVDNDLAITDHCPGFGSAAKYIATTISELERDIGSFDVPAVTIVEIMGRNAGWLAASSALARINGGNGPDLIYLCERPLSEEQFIQNVKEKLKNKSGILIAVSEGIKAPDGSYISDKTASKAVDNFGHRYIAGAARALEELVRNEIGCKVRAVELNLMQRCGAHIASETDIIESSLLGQKALRLAMNNKTGMMSIIKRKSNNPYRIELSSANVREVANKEKVVPDNWISDNGYDVTQEMMNYLLPLIQGETNIKYSNGIPKQVKLY